MTSKRKVRTNANESRPGDSQITYMVCAWGYSHSVGAVVIIVVISSSCNSGSGWNILFTSLNNWNRFFSCFKEQEGIIISQHWAFLKKYYWWNLALLMEFSLCPQWTDLNPRYSCRSCWHKRFQPLKRQEFNAWKDLSAALLFSIWMILQGNTQICRSVWLQWISPDENQLVVASFLIKNKDTFCYATAVE